MDFCKLFQEHRQSSNRLLCVYREYPQLRLCAVHPIRPLQRRYKLRSRLLCGRSRRRISKCSPRIQLHGLRFPWRAYSSSYEQSSQRSFLPHSYHSGRPCRLWLRLIHRSSFLFLHFRAPPIIFIFDALCS